ncbi:class I glutamine amidotransferase-like protein [Leucogyrophana mollusca]|uniref:Class I glutamine amidotransferase-like protein n=1 Tax=Leucogyrophana mollusca TaxID=85980 RepID=A0ACB8BN35_9AGAM|nr:class I glutamine amidotransferase-like protein [Leucogyrophana mollusca]
MIRIALLVCGSIPESEVHGNYFEVYRDLLAASFPNTNPNPDAKPAFDFIPYDVVDAQAYPDEGEHFDAVLISGSAASAYENLGWINRLVAYVADLAAQKPEVKIIGICFGHQIVGRALGGECVPNGKWELGVTEVQLSELGRAVFYGKPTLNIQQVHRDHVPSVPAGLHGLGSTPETPNQGMVKFRASYAYDPSQPPTLTDIHVLTLQGHPEFTAPIIKTIADVRKRAGVFGADVADEGRRCGGLPHDGVGVIGRVIWGVLGVV